MVFWSLAIAVAVLTCAALYYAPRRQPVNAGPADPRAEVLRGLLKELEADEAAGRIAGREAEAARTELAREALRIERTGDPERGRTPRWLLPAGGVALLGLSFSIYVVLGSPDMPAQPLASRADVAAMNMPIEEALAQIEARLAATPDDLRGWQVLAPTYRNLGRFEEAETAYRRIIDLSGKGVDTLIDLAETLILARRGNAEGEPLELILEALALDADDARAQFYLANEQTRAGDYATAVETWQRLIAGAEGTEDWLDTARQGLAIAQGEGVAPQIDQQQIADMVSGLADRLEREGGSLEDWSRLVRSYIVLGRRDAAQAAFNQAVAAFPAATDRGELDTFALAAGLTMPEQMP